jgi:hypothetical protein
MLPMFALTQKMGVEEKLLNSLFVVIKKYFEPTIDKVMIVVGHIMPLICVILSFNEFCSDPNRMTLMVESPGNSKSVVSSQNDNKNTANGETTNEMTTDGETTNEMTTDGETTNEMTTDGETTNEMTTDG